MTARTRVAHQVSLTAIPDSIRRIREVLTGPHGTRQRRRVIPLAVLVGALTGVGVAGFERAIDEQLFLRLLDAPLWVQASAPLVGLLVAAASLRWLAGGASSSTADEYIKAFHDQSGRLDQRPVIGRLIASAATLATGNPMGYEGPSMYYGASIGDRIQRRFSKWFARDEINTLMVAGAAAGVAAIFKAPATGAVFALEVPYQDDLARRMLLPTLFAAASGYVTFAAINGTEALLPISGAPPFDLRDLGGAALLGLVCGGGARVFTAMVGVAKRQAREGKAFVRALIAGVGIAGLFVISRRVLHETLLLGPGYLAIRWSLQPDHAVVVVLLLFALRALATAGAVSGGGVGGMFVPLVVQGALLGRAMGGALGSHGGNLFPALGVAAFLGAGYRVPLAAVMFVAESTGRPGFVVPGLIAAAAAQLMMADSSMSPHQRARRAGHLEHRFELPITSALRTDAITTPSDTTLQELHDYHVTALRMRAIPVVDGDTFQGMVVVRDLLAVERSLWPETTVGEVMNTDVPTGAPDWTLGDALAALSSADSDRLAILDGGRYVGIVTTGEVLKLDEILRLTEKDQPPEPAPTVD